MAGTSTNIRQTAIIGPACCERFLPLAGPRALELRERGVSLAGVSDLRAPYEMGRPDPSFHLVLYTLGGAGRLDGAEGARMLRPGHLLLARAHTPYAYRIRARTWRIAWIHLDGTQPWPLPGERGLAVRRAALPGPMQRAMEGFLEEARQDDPGSADAAHLYARLILLALQRELEPESDARTRVARSRLARLWQAVSGQLQRAWDVEALARSAGMSAVHLNRLTRRLFGTTPMRMVTRLRMERVRDLLRNTDYPLKQVADMVGYETPFALSTAFKRATGASPKAWRRT